MAYLFDSSGDWKMCWFKTTTTALWFYLPAQSCILIEEEKVHIFFNTVIGSYEFSCPSYAQVLSLDNCVWGGPRAEKQVTVMLLIFNILISYSTQGGVYIHDDRLSVSSPVLMWIKVRINLLFILPVLFVHAILWICFRFMQ